MNFSLRPNPLIQARGWLAGRKAHAGALCAALALAACGPKPGPSGQAGAASGASGPARCRPLPESERPTLPGPKRAPEPRAGELWLSLDLPLAVLEAEFERHVPRTLAAEKDRPIGAAGLVTYRVTRGKPKLRAGAGRLTATLPVEIELSLCKPLGSLCIGYGSCRPTYDIKATWDVTPSIHHELADVRLSQKATSGCRVGVDVTDQVTSVVKEQLGSIEERIDDERPPLAPWIDRAISELSRPTLLGAGQCIALLPTELLLDGPVTEGDRLRFGVGLAGTMAEAACDAAPHRGRGLPVTRRAHDAVLPSLEVREYVAAKDLDLALGRAIQKASKPGLELILRESALAESGVLLSIELSGQECGRIWVQAELSVGGPRVRLRGAHVLTGDLDPARAGEIEKTLEVELELDSVTPRWLGELAIAERTDILGTLLRERTGVELVATPPEVAGAKVFTAQGGIWILTDLKSELHLEGRLQKAP